MNQPSDPDTSYRAHVQSWAERNGFADWVIALIWLVVAFVLFQVSAGAVFIGLMLFSGELAEGSAVQEVMMERLDLLFIGNSTGQILFLGLATFLITRLHVPKGGVLTFLRFRWRPDTPLFLAAGALLIVVVQPVVIYLGFLNSLLPVPEHLVDMQVSQYEMFEQFLRTEGVLLFGLFHIALVPAVCEEVLFRGQIQSAFEKSWGVMYAIVLSGIVFGLFHLQLPNLFPLAALGMLLALMTWLSGSLWPAILAHFINNGAAVMLGTTYPELAFQKTTAENLPSVWLLILSIIFTILLIRFMISRSDNV
jgi:uncharacterized protein